MTPFMRQERNCGKNALFANKNNHIWEICVTDCFR